MREGPKKTPGKAGVGQGEIASNAAFPLIFLTFSAISGGGEPDLSATHTILLLLANELPRSEPGSDLLYHV